jgi:hypothetical protein
MTSLSKDGLRFSVDSHSTVLRTVNRSQVSENLFQVSDAPYWKFVTSGQNSSDFLFYFIRNLKKALQGNTENY